MTSVSSCFLMSIMGEVLPRTGLQLFTSYVFDSSLGDRSRQLDRLGCSLSFAGGYALLNSLMWSSSLANSTLTNCTPSPLTVHHPHSTVHHPPRRFYCGEHLPTPYRHHCITVGTSNLRKVYALSSIALGSRQLSRRISAEYQFNSI